MQRSYSSLQRSIDHAQLADAMLQNEDLLVIQDLDGVCMGLVRDPLTRQLDRSYLEAVPTFGRHFRVLTNGEHIGRRGVNRLVDRALGSDDRAGREGLYLPGLAGGGVQLQDALAAVSHPGVSEAELAFLQDVTSNARAALDAELKTPETGLTPEEREVLLRTCVLDNRVSPTLNFNPLYAHFGRRIDGYRRLQHFALRFMRSELERAERRGLKGSFFVHLAPNQGHDALGERLRPGNESDAGTTDFQFMLAGAVKEVGVLVLLNHYLFERYGHYPLGKDFNARNAPSGHGALLELARRAFANIKLPRLIGIGDTVSSHTDATSGEQYRGGSDRGFLTLLQALGEHFSTDNLTVFVDSSGGEVRRPGISNPRPGSDASLPWSSLTGISDAQDPLKLNFLFPGGHSQYIDFFCNVARRYSVEQSA